MCFKNCFALFFFIEIALYWFLNLGIMGPICKRQSCSDIKASWDLVKKSKIVFIICRDNKKTKKQTINYSVILL